jgi:hypothetical protein
MTRKGEELELPNDQMEELVGTRNRDRGRGVPPMNDESEDEDELDKW